ncbi:hypothetical protein CY34DRAFT_436738 [Suillus luteus UH-Slu-Lm8-n1]|uniref:Uncharacterized protein n=1 Tax=Suillus luteus UH-Slu-Lm8-n1 TaxID=930992 RepID=A0A0D0AG58_9AGAM|nr:hypothetical protein CY34DRAFT_436738 [Suillus luteus UH-Slu-Lm8-n1]
MIHDQLPFDFAIDADTHSGDHPLILNMFGPLHVLAGCSVDCLDMVASRWSAVKRRVATVCLCVAVLVNFSLNALLVTYGQMLDCSCTCLLRFVGTIFLYFTV